MRNKNAILKFEGLVAHLIVLIGLILLIVVPGAAQAQTPLDEQINRAAAAIASALTPCSSTKFLECVTFSKTGSGQEGLLARTVNTGNERTTIRISSGGLTADDAQKGFQIVLQSYNTPPNTTPPAQFWAHETFSAGLGAAQNAVLQVSLAPSPDSVQGNGLGYMICGNLSVEFIYFVAAQSGTSSSDGQAWVNTAHSQLKALMNQLEQAMQAGQACNATLGPASAPTLGTITEIDRMRVTVYHKFPGTGSVEKRTGSTGLPLEFGDRLCFSGSGTVKLKWWDGRTVSLSDPNIGRTWEVHCIDVEVPHPNDISGPKIGDYIIHSLKGFGTMIRYVVTPPSEPTPDHKFGIAPGERTVVLGIKGTTLIAGEDPKAGAAILCVEEGTVGVTPLNPALAAFDVTGGNQVRVTASAVGPITPGCTLPDDNPVPQPDPNVTSMTLQAAQRRVTPGDLVLIPVWLVKGANVANINLELSYDPTVVKPEGAIVKGNLLDNALFTPNANQSGIIRAGFAQTSGLSGTGTVLNIPFRVVGQPGDSTLLDLTVTTINDPNGSALTIDNIPGEFVILNPDGTLPGVPGAPPRGGPTGANPPTGAAPPGGIPQGDCDGDATVSESDALCALEMSTQVRPARLIMDVDNSGDVTSRDAVVILQRALGK